MRRLRFTILFGIVLASLVVSACREFKDILVNVEGKQVSFTLPDNVLQSNSQYILYDIAVTLDHCQKECVYWEVVRTSEPKAPLEKYFAQFPIRYGQALPEMQVRQHKPVKSGQYSVVATIAVVKKGSIAESLSVHRVFVVE